MSHTYVITSVIITGDALSVIGTVDGTAVTVNTWVSAAGNSLGSFIAFRNFIAPLMLGAVPPAAVSQPSLIGTFTQ